VPSQSASWASTEVTSSRCPPSDDQVIEPIAIVASYAPSSCTFTALCRPSLAERGLIESSPSAADGREFEVHATVAANHLIRDGLDRLQFADVPSQRV
jgi:hypothetical protein